MSISIIAFTEPRIPDLHICDELYGKHLLAKDCLRAAAELPGGSDSIEWVVDVPGNPIGLPLTREYGECYITVDTAGPRPPLSVHVPPNIFRSMAGFLIDRCVINGGGTGGFVTAGFANLLDYVVDNQEDPFLEQTIFPPSTSFLTLQIESAKSPESARSPGDTDPEIPLLISQYMTGRAGLENTGSNTRRLYRIGAQLWSICSAGLSRSGERTWWEEATYQASIPFDVEMAYECDNDLGSPVLNDCSDIQINQLGPPSDTVSVGPGNTQFLHSSSCVMAISAATALVLTWRQIQAALGTLMNVCLQNPSRPAYGGRAYYQQTAKVSRRKKRQATGINALPPHANLTLFQQQEPWVDPAGELRSCTWGAVSTGASIANC
ncbi:hypothetical protein MMC14_005093 [Varicellaria rhodocarpa]|nr:hypothetical protein [Varicellaria rhodocarpa]